MLHLCVLHKIFKANFPLDVVTTEWILRTRTGSGIRFYGVTPQLFTCHWLYDHRKKQQFQVDDKNEDGDGDDDD